MKSSYFEQFRDDIKEEKEKYEAYSETTELDGNKCDHMGRVKIVNGELRCRCGAGWKGPQIKTLFDLFNAK